MRIGELARRSRLTAHTIRYYERIGLLPFVGRDASGHRDYDASILTWIGFLERLKTTGMPIRTMREYAALRQAGPAEAPDRRLLLERHRVQVRAQVTALREALTVLDTKIAGYADSTEGMNDDDGPAETRRRKAAARAAPARSLRSTGRAGSTWWRRSPTSRRTSPAT